MAMELRADQLAAQLQQRFPPVLLISGDDPFLVGEACDTVRATLRDRHGFSEREQLQVERGFDWSRLQEATGTLSLFAERRLIELRLPSGKPGDEGSKALQSYCAHPADETVLLIISAKLDKRARQTKWVKAVEQVGAVLPIWPIEANQLPPWIVQRARTRGIEVDRDGAALLAERAEGNLLAAAQEIEKLLLLHGPATLSAETLLASVSDSARFDPFRLLDLALQGEAGHALRALHGLREEGTAVPLINAVLSNELRTLAGMATEVAGGAQPMALMGRYRVFRQRQAAVVSALKRHGARRWLAFLQRTALIDRASKGRERADPWRELERLVSAIAGRPLPAATL